MKHTDTHTGRERESSSILFPVSSLFSYDFLLCTKHHSYSTLHRISHRNSHQELTICKHKTQIHHWVESDLRIWGYNNHSTKKNFGGTSTKTGFQVQSLKKTMQKMDKTEEHHTSENQSYSRRRMSTGLVMALHCLNVSTTPEPPPSIHKGSKAT